MESAHFYGGATPFCRRNTIDYTWFISSGIVLLLGITEDGASVEVEMAGRESVIGFPGSVRKNETTYCS
jgi:hypothetical protein